MGRNWAKQDEVYSNMGEADATPLRLKTIVWDYFILSTTQKREHAESAEPAWPNNYSTTITIISTFFHHKVECRDKLYLVKRSFIHSNYWILAMQFVMSPELLLEEKTADHMNLLVALNRGNWRRGYKSTGPFCTWVPPGLSGEQIVCVLNLFLPPTRGTSPLTLQRTTNELFIGRYEDAARSQQLNAVLTKQKSSKRKE